MPLASTRAIEPSAVDHEIEAVPMTSPAVFLGVAENWTLRPMGPLSFGGATVMDATLDGSSRKADWESVASLVQELSAATPTSAALIKASRLASLDSLNTGLIVGPRFSGRRDGQ